MKKLLFVAVVMSSFSVVSGMLDNLVLQSHVGNGGVELTHIKEHIKQNGIYLLEQHCEYVINKLPVLLDFQQQQVVPMLKSAQFDVDAFTFNKLPEYCPQVKEADSVLNQDQYSHLKAKWTSPFSEMEPWLELIKSRCDLIQETRCLQINSGILETISAGEILDYSECKCMMELQCKCLIGEHREYVVSKFPTLSYLQRQQVVPMLKLIQCTFTAMLAAASGNSSLQEYCCPRLDDAQSILTQEQYLHLGMEETSLLSETEPWLRMIEVRSSLVGIANQLLHRMLDLGISL